MINNGYNGQEDGHVTHFGTEVKTKSSTPPYTEINLENVDPTEFAIPMAPKDETKVEKNCPSVSSLSETYPNMTKEDVLKFSSTPFWNTLRLIALIIFWLIWLAFLATVVVLTITTPRCGAPPERQWYHSSVFYDVYVRSFYDYNNDTIGDLQGVEKKLPLLKELGVDAIVLSSILKSRSTTSPSASELAFKYDYGYEVENYKAIDASVGTENDFIDLIASAHKHDMKVIIEFVPNHSSKDHPWFDTFKNAVPYNQGWNSYVSASKEPNSWKNFYDETKSAWVQTDPSDLDSKFHYNQFLSTQVELNLRSEGIREEIEDALKYWLNFGIDGFKIKHSDFLLETSDLRDNPQDKFSSSRYQNDSIDLIGRWRDLVSNFDNNRTRVLLTDGDSTHEEYVYRYFTDKCGDNAHVPINQHLMSSKGSEDLVPLLKNFLEKIPEGFITLWTTGGQDNSRIETSAGQNMTRPLILLKMTLPGASGLYYGEEIEMEDDETQENLEKDPVFEYDDKKVRFGFRQPMYWTNATNAGFSPAANVNPWLKLNLKANREENNVETLKSKEDSVWRLIERLAKMKRDRNSLKLGGIHFGFFDSQVITYVREYQGDDRLLVVLNLSDKTTKELDVTKNYQFPIEASATIALTTHHTMGPFKADDSVDLRSVGPLPPHFGFIAKWKYVREV